MTDESKSLLDLMLDESKIVATGEQPEMQVDAPISSDDEGEIGERLWPDDTEQLLELSGQDLRTWIAAVDPGDLLCVIAEGSQALRARVMGSLDDESIKWLKGNLEIWDPATDALKEKARSTVIDIAHKLVAKGSIAVPESLESDAQEQDAAGAVERDQLTETLVQLVSIAHTQGREALGGVVEEAVHPMLGFGLRAVLEVDDTKELESTLQDRQRSLEAAYRAELELIRQALIAIARGDSPQTFVNRVK